ncbi:hypothetical protein [Rhizobium etli]|uniref:hypothetical protein n=1 Tax=Rhizobium etli TaxID=29449 RepID=UPI0018AD5F2D|nr:hypothetical protein [Rhizobium etli]
MDAGDSCVRIPIWRAFHAGRGEQAEVVHHFGRDMVWNPVARHCISPAVKAPSAKMPPRRRRDEQIVERDTSNLRSRDERTMCDAAIRSPFGWKVIAGYRLRLQLVVASAALKFHGIPPLRQNAT